MLDPATLFREEARPHERGAYRVCSPEETIARVRPLARSLGITRIADVTGLDVIGVPVVMVVRPASRSLSVAQGKGLTHAAAAASGLMESIEAAHAERISGPLLWGSRNELAATHALVRADVLPRLSTSLYSPDLPLLWIEGSDLLGAGPLWVPLEVVTVDYSYPLPPGFGCFTMTSNGLASGNNALEAVIHGLCEVIERHAYFVWSLLTLEEQERTKIDLGTIQDPASVSILERLRDLGVEAAVWEITTDIRLPVFQCALVSRGRAEIGFAWPCYGMGAHPDAAVALQRAFLEAVQTRTTHIAGSRDDLNAEGYLPRFARSGAPGNELTRNGSRPFAYSPAQLPERLNELLKEILAELKRNGITSVGVVDLTRPDLGIAVVRVVVPGLEGLRDGFPAHAEFVPVSERGRRERS